MTQTKQLTGKVDSVQITAAGESTYIQIATEDRVTLWLAASAAKSMDIQDAADLRKGQTILF